MQLIILKLLSKFHVARLNRSRVISKSLKFRTRWLENGRVKTKEHATPASVVPTKVSNLEASGHVVSALKNKL